VLPVPAFVLKAVMGDMSEAVLGGQRVLPRRALEAGYRFQHPELPAALRTLVG